MSVYMYYTNGHPINVLGTNNIYPLQVTCQQIKQFRMSILSGYTRCRALSRNVHSYFKVLNFEEKFKIDQLELKNRQRAMQREVHPDKEWFRRSNSVNFGPRFLGLDMYQKIFKPPREVHWNKVH